MVAVVSYKHNNNLSDDSDVDASFVLTWNKHLPQQTLQIIWWHYIITHIVTVPGEYMVSSTLNGSTSTITFSQ